MLKQSQIDQFEQQGFLVLESLLDGELLDSLEREYSEILHRLIDAWLASGQLQSRPAGSFFDQLLAVNHAGLDWFQPLDISLPFGAIDADTPFHIGPAVFDLFTYKPLLDVAESLIGDELALNSIQHVRIKPPAKVLGEGEVRAQVGGTAWHQDRGVAHEEADKTHMVTAWCAVTEATTANGCLIVIPGPVNDGLLPHCPQVQTHIPESHLQKDKAIALEVPRGSVLLLHPSTPHASLDNNSKAMRWSFDLRYHRIGEASGRSHFPSFNVRSQQAPIVSDWREMHREWEKARDALAVKEHVALHRWSGDSPVCA